MSSLLPRSRALFEGTPSDAAALSPEKDDDDYAAFYKGRHAFECLSWSSAGRVNFICSSPFAPVGFEDYTYDQEVPAALLADRAFSRGFFKAPFTFAMDPQGQIRAHGLSPDITLRDLSARLQAAVSAKMADDGIWKEDGRLDVDNEELRAVLWAAQWAEKVCWGGKEKDISFYDVYWRDRHFIEGYDIKAGSAAGGGFININSWGS